MNLWRGTFNYQGEVTQLYAKARTRLSAFTFMTRQLASKYGVSRRHIRLYFMNRPNHEVEEVKSGTETES